MTEEKFYRIENGSVIVTLYGYDCECMPELGFVVMAGSGIPMPTAPKPPTYTIEALGGVTAQYPHTAETIKDPKTTDEDKELWAFYLDALAVHQAEVQEVTNQRARARTNAIIDRAIKIRGTPSMPDMNAWADRQMDRYGIAVSRETDDDLLMAWIVGNVIRVQADAYKLLMGIAVASGLSPEDMASMEATFLDHMGKPEWAKPATD